VTSETVDPPIVFDADAVRSLTGHPADRELATVLVSRYRGLLPTRVRRIADVLVAGDIVDALDAVLSLKVASATVGARELAEAAGRIENLLRRGDLAGATTAQVALPGAAARADRALVAFLGD
jgi:HPt (histidine-containing phosphotransfer) domain-containing protein